MGIVDDVRKILEIKIKPRQDSYSDQFSRILLVKVMLVGALFTGLKWFDPINCIIPKDQASAGFAKTSCWINGVYIYENIRHHNNEMGYYGIPREVKMDGMTSAGVLCVTPTSTLNVKSTKGADCKPMKKTFFLQYQYMTFFFILIGALYYAPYALFKYVNIDFHTLKSSITDGNAKDIFNSFFNHGINSKTKMSLRVVGNILCKVLYIIANVLAFVITNKMLHGNFIAYGRHYASWTKLNNSMAYDYMGRRHFPKPGDVLLPSFAFCEVHEIAADLKWKFSNKNRFVCEMSQHILYQYIFLLVWWAMVLGILVSVLGLLVLFIDYMFTFSSLKKQVSDLRSFGFSVRECEYLNYIRRKDLPLFGQLLEEIRNTPRKDPHLRPPAFDRMRQDEHEF